MTEPKPFDLEAAKAGAPVMLRNGYKARIICFDRNSDRPIIVLTMRSNGSEFLHSTYSNGREMASCKDSGGDLVMAPVEKTVYLNFVKGSLVVNYYKSEEEAKAVADNFRANLFEAIAVPVTYKV